MTDDASSEVVGPGAGRFPPVIRAACLLLIVTGLASVAFSFPVVLDPAKARCHLSRTWIDDANSDKKEWNNVDIAGRKPKEVPCDEAIVLADGLRIKEKEPDKTATVPGESALRIQNLIAMIIALGQGLSGVLLMRSLSRNARNMALGFGGAGIIMQILGIISLGVFAFVVYALVFSPVSREIWPKIQRTRPEQ